jgi:hypothetical protein
MADVHTGRETLHVCVCVCGLGHYLENSMNSHSNIYIIKVKLSL